MSQSHTIPHPIPHPLPFMASQLPSLQLPRFASALSGDEDPKEVEEALIASRQAGPGLVEGGTV